MLNDETVISKIILGTAQLGQPYGIANASGMPDATMADLVLDEAWDGGINCIDTARVYGESEARIGRWIASRDHHPYIITKVEKIPEDTLNPARHVRQSVEASLELLGVVSIDGLLMHDPADFTQSGVTSALHDLVQEGKVGAYGVSVYHPEDALNALMGHGIKMIQAPMNLFDRRIETSGALDRCAEAGVTVFARSIFLQGLFFLKPDELPEPRAEAVECLRQLERLADSIGYTVAELSLMAVRDTPSISSLVIGAENPRQVNEFLAMASGPPLSDSEREAAFEFGIGLPEEVFNPRLWQK